MSEELDPKQKFLESIKPVANDLKQSLINDQTNLFTVGPVIDVIFPDMPGGVENQITFAWGDHDFYDSFLKVLDTVIQRVLVSDPEFTLAQFLDVVKLAYLISEDETDEKA